MSIIKNGSKELVKNKESTSIYGGASFKAEPKSIINDYSGVNKTFVNRTINEHTLEKIKNNSLIYKKSKNCSRDVAVSREDNFISKYKKITNEKEPKINEYDINGNKRKKVNIIRNTKLNPIGRYSDTLEKLNYIRSPNFARIRKDFFKNNYIKIAIGNGIENFNKVDDEYSKTIVNQRIYRTLSIPRDIRRVSRTLKRGYNGAKYTKDVIKNIKSINNLKSINLQKVSGKGITTSLINNTNSLRGNENIGVQSIVKTKDTIVNTKNTIKLAKDTFKLSYRISRMVTKVVTKVFSNPIMIKFMAIMGVVILGLTLIMSVFSGVIGGVIGEESQIEIAVPTEEQRDFILKIVPIAQENYNEFGIFPSVTIAQAIHESGWGKSELSLKANNLFGIKADSSWTGNTIEMLTQEYINGQAITIMAKWRSYESFDDSIRDHGRFLKENPRYEQAGVFKAKDYREQIYAIVGAGYATDPQYANFICNMIESYSLNIYDFTIGAGNEIIERAIATGISIVGKSPYVFGGGRNPEDIAALRFDCSSFVHWCYANAGINLGDYKTVTTWSLLSMGTQVDFEEIKRGDLIFFDTYEISGHIGIWLGDNKFLHDGTSTGVTVSELTGYYKEKFNGNIRRIVN
ncbi:MAG: glucosaminidase domain-containing protein [uncultured Clostridium sp.]